MFRIYNLLILLSVFICYASYGKAGDGFIGVTEYALLVQADSAKDFFTGVLFLSPLLAGQFALLIAIFKKRPVLKLTIIAIVFLGIVALLVLLLGLFTFSINMILSTMPFFIFSLLGYAKVRNAAAADNAALFID